MIPKTINPSRSHRASETRGIRWGVVACVVFLLLVAVALVVPAFVQSFPAAATPTTAPAPVWVTRVDGVIDPPLASYLVKTIRQANEAGAQLLVVQIDTPGGLDSAMREIIQAEIDSPMPVAFYVYPQGARSASAGVYIMMAADVAAMAPQTNLGSAHPVSLTGEMDEEMKKKVTNDAAAYIKGLATTHGRNAAWAEQAVRESVSLTAEEAKAQDVIEFVARDMAELLRQLDGYTTVPKGVTLRTEDVAVREVSMSWREKFLHAIVNPNVAFLLMLLGIYGLIFELQSPGIGVSGVVGVISLLLALYALHILPVSYVGLALIVVAMVLYVAEVKIQSHGLLGFGGSVALVLGGLLLFNAPGSFLRVDWVVLGTAAACSLAFFALVVGKVAQIRLRRPVTGKEGLLGATGVAATPLTPAGQILVSGELWRAEAEDEMIREGEEVRVIGVDGLTLRVRRSSAA